MTNWRRFREQVPQSSEIRFAWLPVQLYELRYNNRVPYQHPVRTAWLRRVRVVRNVWGDVFHMAIEN